MARSCADLLPPGASIPRSQCFPAMGVTVTAAFCWRDGPAGFLPVGEGPLTVPVVRLRGFPVLQRDHCRLKGAMPSPKAYLVVLLFPGMSYHPRHTCMAIRWHKNATGTSPGLEPGSRRQPPRSRGNHRGPWDPPTGAWPAAKPRKKTVSILQNIPLKSRRVDFSAAADRVLAKSTCHRARRFSHGQPNRPRRHA